MSTPSRPRLSPRSLAVRRHAVALAVLTLAGSPALHAAEAEVDLPRVEVGATPQAGLKLRREQIAAPVQSASDADLRRSGALSPGDFLQRLGSVHLNELQGNALQPDVSYRGFTASPLLGTPQGLSVYVDGVRQNQPFGDTVSWDLLPRSAIAGLTLMPGSNPLFGLNTLGGALAVTTKDGRSHPGGAVQLDVGSHGRRSLEVELGGADDSGWDWYGTGRLLRDGGWRDDSPTRAAQLFGKLGWRDGVTRASLSVAHAETHLTGNGLQEARLLAADWASVYTKPDETRNRAMGATLQVEHDLSRSLTLGLTAYLRSIRSSTFNGDINEGSLDQSVYALSAADRAALTAAGVAYPSTTLSATNTPFPYLRCIAQALQRDEPGEKCNGLLTTGQSEQTQGGLTLQASGRADTGGMTHRYAVGAAWDSARVRYRQSTQLGYLNADRSITGVPAWADGVTGGDVDGEPLDSRVDLLSRSRTTSVFAADTVSLRPDLHLTLAGRYNRTHVVNQDAIHPGGGTDSLDGDHRYGRFNPAIGLSWVVSPAFNAYAGLSQSSRAPTAIELGCANPERPCKLPNAMAGDPPLAQVVTRTAELGLRGQLDARTEWQAGVFRADSRDDILFVADDQAGYGYFRNVERTRRQGVELGLSTRQGAWRVGANYTWLDATFQSAETLNGSSSSASTPGGGLEGTIDVRPGDRIPLVPRQMLKLALGWQATSTLEIELSGVGVAGSLARGNENGAHQADGRVYLGSGRSAGYAVFNLGVAWQPTAALRLHAQVANLADRRYATAAQLGATGFTAGGAFQARPFGGSAAAGYPLQHSTFYAPGAPRSLTLGLRYEFDTN